MSKKQIISKYALPKITDFLRDYQIQGRWQRRGSRVYLSIIPEYTSNSLVRSVQLDKFRFYLNQIAPGCYMTSSSPKLVTFFVYDLVELLKKSVDSN